MGWWGWGSLRDLSKTSKNRGWVKAKVVHRGEGGLKLSPPLPPSENFNHTQASFQMKFFMSSLTFNILSQKCSDDRKFGIESLQ